MARILIADDHPLVRAGVRQILADVPGVRDVGEANSGRETLDQLRAARWDLLLLDINMPDRNGLDVLRHVRASHPDVKVLVLSGLPERQYALNVLRAGAAGFLAKEAAPAELVSAVRLVLAGRRYVSPDMADLLIDSMDQEGDEPPHGRLSEREFQIFLKLAGGRAVSDIAAELALSVKTVSTYRSRVLEKLALRTNADLTAYAIRHELVQM